MASMDKSKFMLSQDFMFESCVLVYHEWCAALETLKAVKKETNDGSKDWSLFHQARLRTSQQAFDKWDRLYNEAANISSRMMVGKDCENID